MVFSGITTALVTPFFEGDLDKISFLKLLESQIQGGITQFVLASTTGESPVLSEEEMATLCKWFNDFKEEKKLPLKLILPTGSNSTQLAVEKTKKAIDLGAQAVLVVTPYYNRPSQKGLLLHFEKLSQQTSLPVILYNVPSRTACSFEVETIKELAQIENIVGIKEATGDMEFLKRIKQNCPKDFLLLSGDDLSCVEFFNLGGHGAISAGANVLPKELVKLFNSEPDNRLKHFGKYKKFLQELFRETNPVGVKQVLYELKTISSPELRLPLVFIKNPALSKELNKLY